MKTVTILTHVILVLSCLGGPSGATIKPWLQDYLYHEEPTEAEGGN